MEWSALLVAVALPALCVAIAMGAWGAWITTRILFLQQENDKQDMVNTGMAQAWQGQDMKDMQLMTFVHSNMAEIGQHLKKQGEELAAIKQRWANDNDGDWWKRGGPSPN